MDDLPIDCEIELTPSYERSKYPDLKLAKEAAKRWAMAELPAYFGQYSHVTLINQTDEFWYFRLRTDAL